MSFAVWVLGICISQMAWETSIPKQWRLKTAGFIFVSYLSTSSVCLWLGHPVPSGQWGSLPSPGEEPHVSQVPGRGKESST